MFTYYALFATAFSHYILGSKAQYHEVKKTSKHFLRNGKQELKMNTRTVIVGL